MNAMTCPTVKIKVGDSFAIINESDFDASKHERFVDMSPLPPPPAVVLPPPPPPPIYSLDALTKDWRNKPLPELRSLAASVSDGRMPENRQQAIQMIEQALLKRGK